MDAADKRMLEREALRNMIQQWNANRLDLFELSEPNENLEFHGVMRFYFQDSGQKIATKCIRVASDATVSDVIETLIEKFRPDMRMLSLGSYSLWETHGPDDERKLEPHEKPLLVQLNWHADDREGRFLLKCLSNNEVPVPSEKADQNFKRKLSKREKKELKKKEKLSRLKSDVHDENRPVAEKLYTELPETSFTRSISNPEAVMRRRRQQKLERKLQQFRSKDGGPDTGGTLKIYGSSLCPDVPYKTLLLSVGDTAAGVVRETLDKYGLSRHEPHHYCIVQVDTADNSEYILEDDECPLAIVMTHPRHSSIMFHVRRRPADSQPRRRKKKVGAGAGAGGRPGAEPALIEVAPDGFPLENGRQVRINDVIEIGSGNGTALQLYGPSIQARHCVVAPAEGGGYNVTPLHTDAHVYVNGRRIVHSQRLQHGCLLKFGRVSTFRFVDPAQENILNRNLAQSQHYGSGSIYDRSPTSPENSGAMSPASMTSHQQELDPNANAADEYPRAMSPGSHDTYGYRDGNRDDTITPYNNNTLKLDNESLMMSQHLNESKDDYMRDLNEHSGSVYNDQDQSVNRTTNSQYKDNYETTFDLDGNVETKSICSAKSGGSGHDNRMSAAVPAARPGQEPILPAVLEFPEAGQAQFLAAVVSRLDPHAPAFKLAPVYTLYLCARYRASTHYRPELTPTERAHKLTAFLHHVASLIHATVQERCTDSAAQAFWMANASELLHFLKYDRHISSFSTQAQDLLPTTVQNAFSNLVSCFQEELSRALATLTNPNVPDATEATAPTLQVLAAAMVLLRRCRVNAALTIQLFSHLFHYINAVCFNKLVTEPGCISARWGAALSARLGMLAAWAERQGLELAADCHLARTHQAARLIQGTYRTAEEARAALAACFKLNSVQVRALLTPLCAPDALEAAVQHARALADELCRADQREITVEESTWLGAALLVPSDGFSADVVRGVPPGLAEFLQPLQRAGLCRLALQPHAVGVWTVYMTGYGSQNRRPPDPRLQIIQLHKNSNGMGLSIVAAKGAGQSKLGIYIKSVVPGGAAAADGRLAAGDQLLSVDGHSLVGITQEKAAEYLVRTGPTVTLEVAKQGAVLHGLATLLHQPAYNQRQDEEVQFEDPARRNCGTYTNTHPALQRPVSPLTELATAGYSRRPCHNRCHLLRDESTESSTTDESEEYTPNRYYCGSIPRLIITLDQENNQLQDDMSPDTPGCPMELKTEPPKLPRPIPVFTFTCEDFDEQQANDSNINTIVQENNMPIEEETEEEIVKSPPPVPDPPSNYDQSSESGDTICLPPEMKPIDTKLTLDLFNVRKERKELFRRRCTAVDECVSACECCRSPQPEPQPIPYIDEPSFDPVIFESDPVSARIGTPKIRRILPSLSIDKGEEVKPGTSDAMCQTPASPLEVDTNIFSVPTTPIAPITNRKLELNLDVNNDSKRMENIHSRLKRTLFSVSKSFSKSEDTDAPSTYSTSDSFDDTKSDKRVFAKSAMQSPLNAGAKQILDSVDRKSWKSPDEYRPAFGKVKALAKHFNDINLKYCVKSYKRNCQSSPNLNVRDEKVKIKDTLPCSVSLADIQYGSIITDTSDTKGNKLSNDEVKSILIQLEDWSKYGSRGSEDTLAQGNEFELPNLPSEDHTDNNNISHSGSMVFNEIVDKKPKIITLDNIQLKLNQSCVNSESIPSKESLVRADSLEKLCGLKVPRVVAMIPAKHASSLLDVSTPKSGGWNGSYANVVQSCPNINVGSVRGRAACAGASSNHSCPALALGAKSPLPSGGSTGALRRASERDLPARLAAEPVKPSKSTPALHHVASPPPVPGHSTHPQHSGPISPASVGSGAGPNAAWANKSRSSHNLSQPQDAFYQNLHTVHSQQALHNSSSGARPQSAHFAAAGNQLEHAPESPLLQQANHNAMSARAAKLAEMSEEVNRRHQHQQQMQQHLYQQKPPAIHPHQHPLSQSQQMLSQSQQMLASPQANMLPNHQLMGQGVLSPSMHLHSGPAMYQAQPAPAALAPHSPPAASYHNHHPHQRYEWHLAGPPSPQRSQPPVAPKPQGVRISEPESEQHMHQQEQSSVQPDDERYVASALEPPAVSVYGPAGGAGGAGAGRPQPSHNPWQREERERQQEARRAANRARRDATIAQLVSLGASRTPVQSQQLRALQLERDFERRATMHDQDESTAAELADEEEARAEADAPAPATAPTPAPPPPKSILKVNTNRSELTNGYLNADTTSTEERISELASSLSSSHMSHAAHAAPPPPERGSSFAVMASHARALSPPAPPQDLTPQLQPQTHSPPGSATGSATSGGGRDKRVSFHERAPPPAATSPTPAPPPPASSPPPLEHTPQNTHTHNVRHDPDRFIEEAESMLAGGATPSPVAAVAHTPGVIGAQEVYRDPRARRLAEKEAARGAAGAAGGAVPEQLSFKEKMKMFALESGEPNTPKDKVKISRAQRDIDAVH